MTVFFCAVVTIVLLAVIGAASWRSDFKNWNGGTCIHNGLKWVFFDTDSQGGRGYKAGNYTVWISWPSVDT